MRKILQIPFHLHRPLRSDRATDAAGNIFPGAGSLDAGFTLVELLLVIAILGVLLALAAPGFRPITEAWRMRSAAEALQSSLYYARSVAIQRGGRVAMAKTGNHAHCALAASSGQWGCGWKIFVDDNSNGRLDSGEEILRTVAATTRMQVTMGHGGDFLQFDRWGKVGSKGLAMELQPVGSQKKTTLCLAISGLVQKNPGGC